MSTRAPSYLPVDLELALKEALERHAKGADGETPPNLYESTAYSLLAPGKRIRPRLGLACAQMLGLDPRTALPPALSIELVHCFTLIHDDLPCMDNDDFRRGKPSNHKVYGEAIALLAGDGLMALALDVFLDAAPHFVAHPERLVRALRRLSWAMGPRGVIGGQAAEALLTESSTLDQMRRMHAQKTGALFAASLLIPMDLAGIDADSSHGLAIDAFSRELGLAFQVADDIEDAGEKPTPTSVLFYLSEKEARAMTLQRLGMASQGLTALWADQARPLLEISGEVAQKLQGAPA